MGGRVMVSVLLFFVLNSCSLSSHLLMAVLLAVKVWESPEHVSDYVTGEKQDLPKHTEGSAIHFPPPFPLAAPRGLGQGNGKG